MDLVKFDQLLDKVKIFTDTEDVCLAVWLEAVLRGRFAVAREILRTGLLLEHWQSLIPEDRENADEDYFVAERKFEELFKRALDKFNAQPSAEETAEDERGNHDARGAGDYQSVIGDQPDRVSDDLDEVAEAVAGHGRDSSR